MNFEQLKDRVASILNSLEDRWDADAPAALTRQLEHVKSQAFDREYPLLKARKFIPVDTSAGPAAETIKHRLWTKFGAAKVGSDLMDDIPLAGVDVQEFSTIVQSIVMGYAYTIQELRASAKLDRALDSARADAARRAMEVKIDDIAAFGVAEANLEGFLNNSNVPLQGLTTGSWAGATSQEILEDLYAFEEEIISATEENHSPTTLLLPGSLYQIVRTKPMTTTGENPRTVLETFMMNAQSVREVDRWSKMETADAAGTGPRIMMYERSPSVCTLEIPQDIEQFPPQAVNLAFKVPMHARVGGVRFTYPLAAVYSDSAG